MAIDDPARQHAHVVVHKEFVPHARSVVAVPEDPRSWQEVAASNRERINFVERETERMRERLHAIESESAATHWLGEQIREQGEQVKRLAEQVEGLSRRFVERPSQGALSVFGQYIALVVAVVAFIFAATR